MKKFIIAIIVISILVVGYFSIRNSPRVVDSGKPKLAATIFPLADIVRQIAGDSFEVVQLLPTGASEHTFSPTVDQVKELQGVSQVFTIGEIDSWILDLVKNQPQAVISEVSQGIDLKQAAGATTFDPHYWLSYSNANLIGKNVLAVLIQAYPDQSVSFVQRYGDWSTKVDADRQTALAEVGKLNNKKIITFHEAWSYFADDLGLQVAGTFEPFPGQEPTAEYLAALQKTIADNGIKIIYTEPQLSDASIKSLATDLGVRLKILDPLGGVEGRNSYLELMRYNVEQIIQ